MFQRVVWKIKRWTFFGDTVYTEVTNLQTSKNSWFFRPTLYICSFYSTTLWLNGECLLNETHPLQMMSASFLWAFTKTDNWAELNQILRHVGKWTTFANAHEDFVGFPPLKIEELIAAYFGTVFNYERCWNDRTGSFTHPL